VKGKITRAEIVVICLTLAFVSFTIGYFTGKSNTGDGYRIETQYSASEELEEADTSTVTASTATAAPLATEATSSPTSTVSLPTLETAAPININTAELSLLTLLPGIGETLAQRIIDYREAYGDFESIEDIMKVSGIGNERYLQIADYITV
jgi:competence protein ComEA